MKTKFVAAHRGTTIDDYENYDCVIINFQLTINKPSKHYERFTSLMVDEVHRATSKSYVNINKWCTNLRSTRGVTGTMYNDNSAETLKMICSSGFLSKTVKKRELINQGRASDGVVHVRFINPLSDEATKKLRNTHFYEEDHIAKLNHERKLIRESQSRFEFIITDIRDYYSTYGGNGVVFFKDVQNGYGKRIYERLSSTYKDVSVFYIDGNTDQKLRQEAYSYMREHQNCILVVSYDIFATGISISNLVFGYLAEPIKSFVLIGQTIGRYMRLHDSKDKFHLIDVVDVVNLGKTSSGKKLLNYYYKWYYYGRHKSYVADEFKIEEKTIKLKNNNLF